MISEKEITVFFRLIVWRGSCLATPTTLSSPLVPPMALWAGEADKRINQRHISVTKGQLFPYYCTSSCCYRVTVIHSSYPYNECEKEITTFLYHFQKRCWMYQLPINIRTTVQTVCMAIYSHTELNCHVWGGGRTEGKAIPRIQRVKMARHYIKQLKYSRLKSSVAHTISIVLCI